jgi:drug/metabolite transporter (DMT)-like permease
MELYLILIALVVSFSWNLASFLIKEGLYYTSPLSALFMKALVFFLVSMLLLVYFKITNKKINPEKSKRALKYFVLAVAFTFFLGTISFLHMLKKVEKISIVIFLQSIFTLFLVSILSYFFLGERLNLKQIIGIIIGLFGTAVIIFNSNLYKKN